MCICHECTLFPGCVKTIISRDRKEQDLKCECCGEDKRVWPCSYRPLIPYRRMQTIYFLEMQSRNFILFVGSCYQLHYKQPKIKNAVYCISFQHVTSACLCRSRKYSNLLEAAAAGASQSIALVANIAANLIAFIALLAFANAVIAWLGGFVCLPDLSFEVSNFIFARPFVSHAGHCLQTSLSWGIG